MNATVVIDMAVLAGVALVIPLALGRYRSAIVATAAVATSMVLPTGAPAGAVAAVWLVLAGATLLTYPDKVAAGFALVAASAFTASRAGLTPFGIAEPIVELTAVHFTYAGVGAYTLARRLDPKLPWLRTLAIALSVSAPPVVAVGFLTHHPIPQVGGAVLMSAAVLLVAVGELREALMDGDPTRRRALLAVSGVAPWIPMGLAVAWAASNFWAVPALSIPDMVRIHGTMNAVFVISGLLARRPTPTGDPGNTQALPAAATLEVA